MSGAIRYLTLRPNPQQAAWNKSSMLHVYCSLLGPNILKNALISV